MTVNTDRVLEEAIGTLGHLRGLAWLGDSGATLHLLVSLLHEAERQLPTAVANARDQEYSWTQIADLLGVTRASAWQRYAGHTNTNRTPTTLD